MPSQKSISLVVSSSRSIKIPYRCEERMLNVISHWRIQP